MAENSDSMESELDRGDIDAYEQLSLLFGGDGPNSEGEDRQIIDCEVVLPTAEEALADVRRAHSALRQSREGRNGALLAEALLAWSGLVMTYEGIQLHDRLWVTLGACMLSGALTVEYLRRTQLIPVAQAKQDFSAKWAILVQARRDEEAGSGA